MAHGGMGCNAVGLQSQPEEFVMKLEHLELVVILNAWVDEESKRRFTVSYQDGT